MDKQAEPGNSVTRLPVPLIGDINNRRFMTAVLSGILGGAGVSAAANLLRQFRELRKPNKEETDDETIVLTLPPKAAGAGYDSMAEAKPGETKITANGGTQSRNDGKYGKGLGVPKKEKDAVKCADGNPGPNTVGTVVANALGLTAGGLLSYDLVSRLFDAMNERRLKRKLQAAQESYVNAMTGASKRAEAILRVTNPVEHVLCKAPLEKTAGVLGSLSDLLPDAATNALRYPTAAYILALLAGTGATSYVTKKVMDREFPEEKLKKDINRPTRIVFRTVGGKPELAEGEEGQEKAASAETCAALTALLPIYMDVVEGQPSRTLAEPYRKIAEANGTDAAGLMKLAQADLSQAYMAVLKDPKALWAILKGTNFGLNFSKLNAAKALRTARPDTYRRAVDAAIDATFAGGPNDGLVRKGWNAIQRAGAKTVAALGGRDWLVDKALAPKTAEEEDDSILGSNYLASVIRPDRGEEATTDAPDPESVLAKAKAALKARRKVTVEAGDPNAAAFVGKNKAVIKKLLARLNAQGTI